ncbi:dihydrofolate reductase family protein [Nocardioides speluncae]|uniref:dihydrofolate reductase family protein n=1 Tax=Nocardioides speluncae TaxID=2670337 RepID=UPI000D68DC18|nr:dihydrofolate reductase [Nocardioides speluncae]
MRKMTYYVGLSVDGYIAGPEGEVDFYGVPSAELIGHWRQEYPEVLPTHVRAAMGSDEPNRRFDTIVMGRATYDLAYREGITSPYAHLKQYVVSSRLPEDVDPAVTVVREDPAAVVRALKEEDGLDIYLAGGGKLASHLIDEVDELIVKRYPVIAGAGTPMFGDTFSPTQFRHVVTHDLDGGQVSTFARV